MAETKMTVTFSVAWWVFAIALPFAAFVARCGADPAPIVRFASIHGVKANLG